MAVINKQAEELITDSLVYQIQQGLTTLGWSNTTKWVIIGYVEPEGGPAVVAIDYNREVQIPRELGSKRTQGIYIFNIEIRGTSDKEASTLKDMLIGSGSNDGILNPLRIINTNTAMPGDGGFNAVTQTITWASVSIKNAVVISKTDYIRRLTAVVTPKGLV